MGRQILRAEQIGPIARIALLAIDDQVIRQSARLGTLPPIRAAAAEGFAGQTLAAVSNAQRPVNKHLDRHGRTDRYAPNVVKRQFTGENHALDTQTANELDSPRLGER